MTDIINQFRKKVLMTLNGLSALLNVSVRTVQRKLQQLDTIRSYDHNGRFFALNDAAQFNQYGIWEYDEIHFSKYGNLKKTLIQIIINSDAGINASEIRNILGLEPRSFLFQYKDTRDIKREKTDGCFVYFSSDPKRYNFQSKQRKNLTQNKLSSPLSDSVGIVVLAETIKHPKYSIERLSKHLLQQGVRIKPATIIDFFNFYGIEKKTNFR